jgi:hypothetical protein
MTAKNRQRQETGSSKQREIEAMFLNGGNGMSNSSATACLRAQPSRRSVVTQVRAWLLLIPLVFLAVHGEPSFLQTTHTKEGGDGLSVAAESSGSQTDQGLERTFVYLAYGVVGCLCVQEHRRIRSGLRFARPMLWLAGLALCSTLWSQVPLNSLRYASYYTLDTLLAVYLVTAFKLEEMMGLVRMAGVAVVCCSAVMVVAFPQYGIVHAADHTGVWQGIFSEKNDAAKNLMFLLTPVMGSQILGLKNLLYAALLLPFIVMTGSKSALVALLAMVMFAVCVAAFRRMSAKTAAFAATTIGLTLATIALMLAATWAQTTAMLGRDATLTGRTVIWGHLIDSGIWPWAGSLPMRITACWRCGCNWASLGWRWSFALWRWRCGTR